MNQANTLVVNTKISFEELMKGFDYCQLKYSIYDGGVTLNLLYKTMFTHLAKEHKIVAIGFDSVNGHTINGRFAIGTIARLDSYSDRVCLCNRNDQIIEVRYHEIDRVYIEGVYTPEWRTHGNKDY